MNRPFKSLLNYLNLSFIHFCKKIVRAVGSEVKQPTQKLIPFECLQVIEKHLKLHNATYHLIEK
ncbi:hypothetical protein BpHYR1_029598 [Brachionus plicatilis]|uniref:Uncharacterized protein n=1 Tax=Brachionus plicatilis TaxID=10195 RepID=A0A3M7SKE4_BRAPC|nr:hypothetical protein BpHYR1_029598 [Brachionus plicatilis]